MAEFCDLPEDVVSCILVLLPVTTLLRCKSVCKSLCSVIGSSNFIDKHLKFPPTSKNNCDLIVMIPVKSLDTYFPEFSLLSGEKFEVSTSMEIPGFLDNERNACWTHMVASCNGVICLRHGASRHVSLWNPATRQFRILPELQTRLVRKHKKLNTFLGFGFDIKSNDYKVVKLMFMEYAFTGQTNQVEVYSLSTDSWRIIDVVLPVSFIVSNPRTPYRDEIYCWLGKVESQENGSLVVSYLILSFNFNNEVFETMALPTTLMSNDGLMELAILRENLACINRVGCNTEGWHFEIWMMNEFGIKESWTKLHTVGPFPKSGQIGFSKKGEFLLLLNYKRLCLYDLFTQEEKNLGVGAGPFSRVLKELKVVLYRESLVSITSRNDANNTGHLNSFDGYRGKKKQKLN
ncbi:hypothetical protein IFM89_001748 [Coptis chinensis]|uniref:F-box domain-containing protein n=1 Tax=Coptis chinensis TaxID=261450 RepID=A0A835HK62_9MAGN|nr:hypothetical protein IFM89_001748 [Coptis chinensis]